MTTRALLPALAAAAAVAALAAGATGAATNPAKRLAVGDAVDVTGTGIACFAITSNKKDGLACVLWKGGGPRPGTFGVGIAVDGTVVMNQMLADGTAKTLYKRILQARAQGAGSAAAAAPARAGDTVYTLGAGHAFGLPVDAHHSLVCNIANITSAQAAPLYRGIKVGCWKTLDTLALPNSGCVQISDKLANVCHMGADGAVDRVVLLKRQPAP